MKYNRDSRILIRNSLQILQLLVFGLRPSSLAPSITYFRHHEDFRNKAAASQAQVLLALLLTALF